MYDGIAEEETKATLPDAIILLILLRSFSMKHGTVTTARKKLARHSASPVPVCFEEVNDDDDDDDST